MDGGGSRDHTNGTLVPEGFFPFFFFCISFFLCINIYKDAKMAAKEEGCLK